MRQLASTLEKKRRRGMNGQPFSQKSSQARNKPPPPPPPPPSHNATTAPYREVPPSSPVGAVVGDEDGERAVLLHWRPVNAIQQADGHGQLTSQRWVTFVQLLQALSKPRGKIS